MNNQNYINDFKLFADKALDEKQPNADESLTIGTIARTSSYLESFKQNMKELETVLVNQANKYLIEAKDNSTIETSKLKEELFTLAKTSIQTFISKYKL